MNIMLTAVSLTICFQTITVTPRISMVQFRIFFAFAIVKSCVWYNFTELYRYSFVNFLLGSFDTTQSYSVP